MINRDSIINILVLLACFAAIFWMFGAHAKTFSEEPKTKFEYEDDNLAAQMNAKKGIPPCVVLAKMANDIQVIRHDTGDSYPEFYNRIEARYPDTPPVFDDNGMVVKRGHIQVLTRR